MFLKSIVRNTYGQGLIEAIAGIFVIVIGLIGVLSIAHSSISSHYEAKTRIIAANLAREGVEVVHNIRDSNWIAGRNWDNGLYSINDYHGVPVFAYNGDNSWQIDFNPDNFSDVDTEIYEFQSGVYKGLFLQKDPSSVNAVKTLYKRFITLKVICYDSSSGIEDAPLAKAHCLGGNEKIGVRIISEIRWTEHNRSHSLIVEDSVYDWR
ncbi:hypothetical protein ACFL23_03480 [Patescibacteria group bacterium]